jgi:hypothetical protein
MSEPRAQRTLVKSPPELWAEISDVSTLARHLGELGDIRITRLQAQTTVVWEGDRARGTVELEPSGWGTKVTITAEAIAVAEAEVEPEPEPVAEAEPEPVAEAEPEPVAEEALEAVADTPEPAPRRRALFARFFGRKAPEPVVVIAPPAPETEPEREPVAEQEPVAETPPAVEEPVLDGEIVAAALGEDELEAVLVSVLDDLGSAHHRPFSRG